MCGCNDLACAMIRMLCVCGHDRSVLSLHMYRVRRVCTVLVIRNAMCVCVMGVLCMGVHDVHGHVPVHMHVHVPWVCVPCMCGACATYVLQKCYICTVYVPCMHCARSACTVRMKVPSCMRRARDVGWMHVRWICCARHVVGVYGACTVHIPCMCLGCDEYVPCLCM